MYTVKVNLGENSYSILIGSHLLADIGEAVSGLKLGSDALVVTHPCIQKMHGPALQAGLKKKGISSRFLPVPEGERSKSVRRAFQLIGEMAQRDVQKRMFIIAFGGGVVGDLAGFVAAVYKRGIPFIQVPTTFLAQIDSAIGGKVAVDLPQGKNLIGAFYQPRLVLSDVSLLATLSRRQVRNGFAEAVKYGIICDSALFSYIEQKAVRLMAREPAILTEVIYYCSRIKANIVSGDERETRGMRTILNFGHTVGHAIEAAAHYRYAHGEAVALGMRAAVHMSLKMGMLNPEAGQRIHQLLTTCGLPEKIKGLTTRHILQHMRHDKKFKGAKNRFVLATGIGSVKIMEGVEEKVIKAAIQSLMG